MPKRKSQKKEKKLSRPFNEKEFQINDHQVKDLYNSLNRIFGAHRLTVPQVMVFIRTYYDSLIKTNETAYLCHQRFEEYNLKKNGPPTYIG